MESVTDRVQRNLAGVQARIASALARAGRAPGAVQLVAVTKAASLDEIRALIGAGCTHFGENRIETAVEKITAFSDLPLHWHMIGNVQRRKLPQILEHFQHIDAVDRDSLFEPLQRRCETLDCTAHILLEVNVSGEEAKHGFRPEDVSQALQVLHTFDRVQVHGLLTMAPFDAPETDLRRYFRGLHTLATEHGLHQISMGMTHDFEIAIEEGATQVRIGTALFE
ncbi:MAG: YggS family pyridoxal phosphate-dependent enzyme [Candidatus Hydrogenedentes bacterium]|nr:YggS family pyridoxal phosphate-dependent enzyme [Candidatus Hydrogenedentota bacterium]